MPVENCYVHYKQIQSLAEGVYIFSLCVYPDWKDCSGVASVVNICMKTGDVAHYTLKHESKDWIEAMHSLFQACMGNDRQEENTKIKCFSFDS